jgi:hypothetical protein
VPGQLAPVKVSVKVDETGAVRSRAKIEAALDEALAKTKTPAQCQKQAN